MSAQDEPHGGVRAYDVRIPDHLLSESPKTRMLSGLDVQKVDHISDCELCGSTGVTPHMRRKRWAIGVAW